MPIWSQPTSSKLRLLSPQGGESFQPGDTVVIMWTGTWNLTSKNNEDSVRIDLSVDNGKTWQRIVEKLVKPYTFYDTTYQWIVPRFACDECKIRVVQTAGNLGAGDMIAQKSIPEIGSTSDILNAVFSDYDSLLVLNLRDTLMVIDPWHDYDVKILPMINPESSVEFGDIQFGLRDSVIIAGVAPKGVGGDTGYVHMWSSVTGELLHQYPYRPGIGDDRVLSPVTASMSPDGSNLLIAGGTAVIWDVQKSQKISNLQNAYCTGAQYSPDGKLFVLGSDYAITLWDSDSQQIRWVYGANAGVVQFSGDGQYILTLPYKDLSTPPTKESCRLLNVERGDTVFILPLRNVNAADRYARLTKQSTRFQFADYFYDYRNLNYYYRPLTGITTTTKRFFALTPTGSIVADVSKTGTITLWDITRQPADTLDIPFAIAGQLPIAVNQFLGSVEVGKSNDTLIQAFLVNGSKNDIQVQDFSIVSGDVNDFAITSGDTPFTLPSGQSASIGVRFSPSDTGVRSAVVEVNTEYGPVTAEFFGVGKKRTTTVEEERRDDRRSTQLSMSVHPNPASDNVTILYSTAQTGRLELLLFDITGRELDHIEVGEERSGRGRVEYDTQELLPGTYRLELRAANAAVGRTLIIVR